MKTISSRMPKTAFSELKSISLLVITLTGITTAVPAIAQTNPPTMGQDTKGAPAVEESRLDSEDNKPNKTSNEKPPSGSAFGEAKVSEFRRESGQPYRIELKHSSGAKQYIEENDSDGKIGSTSNDIEETPNLPKWKLGSW